MQYLSALAIATAVGLIGLATHFSSFDQSGSTEATTDQWYT